MATKKRKSAKGKALLNEAGLKLDIGCGPHPRDGFVGVDAIKFDGVDVVADLTKRWPWKDNTVDEVHCSHVIEHFDGVQRCHVMNEMYRVLKPGGKATIIAPHWASSRAYGDPTHQWPPIGEFWFMYLSAEWRKSQAPHADAAYWASGYNCDFQATWGYSVHPEVQLRNQEYQTFAVNFYKEAAQDVHATLVKR